jgi:hypothetical protein
MRKSSIGSVGSIGSYANGDMPLGGTNGRGPLGDVGVGAVLLADGFGASGAGLLPDPPTGGAAAMMFLLVVNGMDCNE